MMVARTHAWHFKQFFTWTLRSFLSVARLLSEIKFTRIIIVKQTSSNCNFHKNEKTFHSYRVEIFTWKLVSWCGVFPLFYNQCLTSLCDYIESIERGDSSIEVLLKLHSPKNFYRSRFHSEWESIQIFFWLNSHLGNNRYCTQLSATVFSFTHYALRIFCKMIKNN